MDRKLLKTDSIEPKITVDFNFEGMAFIVLDYIFTKSVQSELCFTLRKPAHATYSDFFTAVKMTIFILNILITFIFLLKT